MDVQELLRLIDDGVDDIRMRVPGGGDGDPGSAVEKQVAVDVFDGCALTARDDERIVACI